MNSRVLLRSSRHPSSTAVSALPAQSRQIPRSSVSQSLVHRLLHPPRTGKTSPSVQFQNSFLFASSGKQAGTSRREFSSTAGKRDSGKKSDGSGFEGDNRGRYEGKESREVRERDEKSGLKYTTSKEKEPPKSQSDLKKQKGNNEKPVFQHHEPSATYKGELQSTSSRLLKLLLPLSGPLVNNPNPPAEPLTILLHPQQPLSYLERLIQAELAPMKSSGIPRPPNVTFKAVDLGDALLSADRAAKIHDLKLLKKDSDSGIVRWSTCTEIGDFVRDAARTKEFIIEIEGSPDVPVNVPSFKERTSIQRRQLKKTTMEIMKLQELKGECDAMARVEARRVAMGGFAGLIGWGAGVYWLTFETRYGWDVMEPVTYLVSLLAVVVSYSFFLYNNREVSYQSVLSMTVSKRQMKQYQSRGFDLDRWEELVRYSKKLRKEIRAIAEEYDEIWDESGEVEDERVRRVLKDDGKKEEVVEEMEGQGERGKKGKE